MLSIVIPSYKDPLLHKTIDSLLENAMGEVEVIPVLDGYWPQNVLRKIPGSKSCIWKNRGMRRAINAGIDVARGEFLMRSVLAYCGFVNKDDKWFITREDINFTRAWARHELLAYDYFDKVF